MIISYRHNFIFIRTRKTASTTVETVLKASLSDGDMYVHDHQLAIVGSDKGKDTGRLRTHMKAADICCLVRKRF